MIPIFDIFQIKNAWNWWFGIEKTFEPKINYKLFFSLTDKFEKLLSHDVYQYNSPLSKFQELERCHKSISDWRSIDWSLYLITDKLSDVDVCWIPRIQWPQGDRLSQDTWNIKWTILIFWFLWRGRRRYRRGRSNAKDRELLWRRSLRPRLRNQKINFESLGFPW